MKSKKRIAALLMAGAMICSAFPVNVLALENPNQNTGGLCEHHTEHDAGCGYTEGSEGTPCTHEHNEGCYTLVTQCVHEHTGDCCPEERGSDNTAAPAESPEAEPTECKHQCSEENSCITKKLDCRHEHGSECGYTPATEGKPCTYVCEICSSTAQPAAPADKKVVSEWTWNLPAAAEATADDKILDETTGNLPVYRNDRWELALPVISDNDPMSKEQVIELLPKEIVLTWEKAEEEPQSKPNQAVAALTWEIEDYPEQGAFSGEFIATATLPAEYPLKENAVPLQLFLSLRNQAGVSPEILQQHELDTTLSPAGTKINLFDYWLSDSEGDRRNPDHQPLRPDGTENHDNDSAEDVEGKSKGINKGHVLKFISWGGDWQGYNRWTENVNLYEGIVARKLDENGYPVIEHEPKDFTWSDWNNNI